MRDVSISAQTIKSLVNSPPSGTKSYLWDREVRGFGVYKTSAGRATFVYRYRAGPGMRLKTLGNIGEMTCAQARDLARGHAYKRRLGIDPIQEERDRIAKAKAEEALSLRVFTEEYIERKDRLGKPFNDGVKATIRNQILPPLGHIRIDQVTLPLVEAAGRALEKERGTNGRWFYSYIKQILNEAENRNVIAKSPLKALAVPTSNERDRVLSPQELRLSLMAMRDMDNARGDMFETLLRLPKRKSEVVKLPWEEITLPWEGAEEAPWRWLLPGGRSKNREGETIVLPRQVRAILEAQQPDQSRRTGRVFSRGGKRNPALDKKARDMLDGYLQRRIDLARDAGEAVPTFEHFTTHDFRTAITTTLQERPFSIEPHVLEAMLNHKVRNKVQRTYQRGKYVEEIGEALVAWNDHLDGLLGDPATWPGGAELPKLSVREADRLAAILTADWPRGADGKGEDED